MSTRPRIIDAWIQPWTSDVTSQLDDRTLHVFRQYGRGEGLESGVPIEEMISDMDEAGIDLALLSAGPMIPTDLVLKTIENYPERFRGVAWVDPTKGIMKALAELEHLVRNYPICAFKLEPFILRLDPTDRVFYPIYAKCAELGITLQTQVGGTGPLLPSRTGQPLLIDDIALDFPELRIVCGHVGSPWVAEMIHIAFKHPNVWIDTSARLPKRFEPEFLQYLRTYGQDKCIFATDWPVLDFARPVQQAADLGLPPEVYQKFMVDNAVAAFDLQL